MDSREFRRMYRQMKAQDREAETIIDELIKDDEEIREEEKSLRKIFLKWSRIVGLLIVLGFVLYWALSGAVGIT